MLPKLTQYYIRHSMRLSVAIIALAAVFVIQIKHWVFYSHDCLFLNPYQVTQEFRKPSADLNQALGHQSDNCGHSTPGTAQARDPAEQHNHNDCVICQSFQHITNAIFTSSHIELATKYLNPLQLYFKCIQLNLVESLYPTSQPRAPPGLRFA